MKKPKIIAHRGFWKTDNTIENTIKSLRQAQQLDIYGTEFDVRMSMDGVPLIFHDEFLEDLEISKTDYKSLFSAFRTFKSGFLPTLEQFLTYGMRVPSHKLLMEIKPANTEAEEKILVESVIYLIEKLRMRERLEYISFSLNICKLIKQWDNNANVKYLNGDLSPSEISEFGIDGMNYEYEIWKSKPEWIEEAKELNLSLGCWTVNEPEKLFELAQTGIEFITTDYPDFFIDLINS